MSKDLRYAIFDFVTGIKRDESGKVSFIALYERAFQLAWKDMATHTLRMTYAAKKLLNGDSKANKANRVALRQQLSEQPLEGFKELLQAKEFNQKHKEVCEFICDELPSKEITLQVKKGKDLEPFQINVSTIYEHTQGLGTFTYGQAQKLVNMTIKYLYVYYQLYEVQEVDGIRLNSPELYHIPVDSFVIDELKDCSDFPGEKIPKKEDDKTIKPWSQWCYDDYEKFFEAYQKKKKALFGNESPFLWEMRNWPFDNKPKSQKD